MKMPTANGPAGGTSSTGRERRYLPLLQRLAGMNALLLVLAVVVTIVVLAPHRVSGARLDEEVVAVIAAVGLVLLVNVVLVRRLVRPLQALTALVRQIDPDRPGQRMPAADPRSEAGELALGFNEMLARLEAERREATGRVLAGQEAERLRIAQELHDQVGQELTAALLLLSRVQSRSPEELRPGVSEAQDAVRESLEDVRRIAIELRPEALDDLGLPSALAVLGERFAERAGLNVEQRIGALPPGLSPEVELVIYRIAQEALTNVARHSGSRDAQLALERRDGQVVLSVGDRGAGIPAGATAGSGIRGMRERAGLIGARLTVGEGDGGEGCEVRLEIPIPQTEVAAESR